MSSRKAKYSVVRLSKESKRLISYWRASILEGERGDVSSGAIRNDALMVPASDFLRGHIPPGVHSDLMRKSEKPVSKSDQSKGEQDSRRNEPIEVLICPLRFEKSIAHETGPRFVEVLWVPAILSPDGKLKPPQNAQPWITRDVLEPAVRDDFPIIGSIKAVEKFSRKNPVDTWKSWQAYTDYAAKLVRAVSGYSFQRLDVEGYRRVDRVPVIAERQLGGSYGELVSILDAILDGKLNSSVLAAVASTKPASATEYANDKWILAQAAKAHVGHFTDQFPLSDSQRQAVHRFLELKEGEFLSITGPPGTGKTTVLQSIIATAWVQAALEKKGEPPLIVCTGATNQSVKNIIDCFEKTANEEGFLPGRWLPNVQSYGTYCVSATKAEEVSHYQIEVKDGNGFSSKMEHEEYLEQAEKYYLRNVALYYPKATTVQRATQALHETLQKEFLTYRKEVEQAADLGFIRFLLGIIRNKPPVSFEAFQRTLPDWDIKRRNKMFQIATHYWEGRWLLSCSELLKNYRTGRKKPSRLACHPDSWKRRAMVTPAFVSTLSMLPRFFRYSPNSPEPPVDILICDEAGQIPVEVGAPTLALSKKAIIVGDCLQLEPFWVVQPHIDIANLEQHGLAKISDTGTWDRLSEQGALASNGSLMKLALRTMPKKDRGSPGILLSEQRRSLPPLVAFCNELAYENKLRPMRSAKEKHLFPEFAYIHVPGSMDMMGTSRINRKESREIVNWLLEKESELLRAYKAKSLVDVVAIITPFAAQHREIRRLLPERLSRLIVGTVNGLQGAERPVVLFSTVYDETFEGTYFFDNGLNMLNVAVSRAKDSFIVFSQTAIFELGKNRPSSVLAKYLFASEDNELPLALKGSEETKREAEPIEGDGERIDTLDEHINVLREAFLQAQKHVLVVSPTVSSAAILSDRLPNVIKDTVERGVRVEIYADYLLNRDEEEDCFKEKNSEGFELIRQTGAELHIVGGIHLKSIVIDEHTIVEGSFNWLSANRRQGSRHQKMESSWIYSGKKAKKYIDILHDRLAYYRERGLDDLVSEAMNG